VIAPENSVLIPARSSSGADGAA